MYNYDQYDKLIVKERVKQYKNQVLRRFSGKLTEDEFRILRLKNGIYMQRHAYMLRIAIPYGILSSKQMYILAFIANKYDKNYGHFTTRQNIQFNWINIKDSSDILEKLLNVEMHSIQTSGNCIRNITSDEFSGISKDEIIDVRPYAELIRQWSTLHPEFSYLPRKFKISINGSFKDRTATLVHDIGLYAIKNKNNKTGFKILVGGGMGRTPILAKVICEFLPWKHIITYLESILRIYNQYGRRDNIYKSRIKILVKSIGYKNFCNQVNNEWKFLKNNLSTLTVKELKRTSSFFTSPINNINNFDISINIIYYKNNNFYKWFIHNVKIHKIIGYSIVIISLKNYKIPPGDIIYNQMNFVANISNIYSSSEIRIIHNQNLILPYVKISNLYNLWKLLNKYNLSTPNIGLLTDIICCPGGNFCSLANAKSIPIAIKIHNYFKSIKFQEKIGNIELNISGCINACGHHHIGNIGILGVDKDGFEWFQISLGGNQGINSSIGKIIGPAFAANKIVLVIKKILKVYLKFRKKNEIFINCFNRIGILVFKKFIYSY